MAELSIPSVLRERASLQANDTAFTYIDYEQDWDGVAETITYSQLYRRSLNVAQEIRRHGSTGDRAVIVAPQGLGYVDAFFGALLAGLVAVPLAVPLGGAVDERVKSVLGDAAPTVVLTTSAVVGDVAEQLKSLSGGSAPHIVEVDLLDLEARNGSRIPGGSRTDTAYLQYTSGSTRAPAGVEITYPNLMANFGQMMADYFSEYGSIAPSGATFVSWLPFYHDMGLLVGVCVPVLAGVPAVLTSPTAFLTRPARWLQLLARHGRTFSAGPNFAFEVAARKTSDEEIAGLDLSNVIGIINGSERVQPATLERFTKRFASYGLPAAALRPSYGMAEATVYLVTRNDNESPRVVHFDSGALAAGRAERCESSDGTALVSYGAPRSPVMRIVDPDTRVECTENVAGEIWAHGDNIASGYWRKSQETENTFGAQLVNPSSGTPEGPWLRTGDLGFLHEGELFIIGRIKDLLIVYGRNHSPDDIEGTIQLITRGRCVAIAVAHDGIEKLVAIAELKNQADQETRNQLQTVRNQVVAAISTSHGLSVADLVLVSPGSIPLTTSGKVRRHACVEQYQRDQFARLDA